jgi:hypothetical protein
MEGKKGDKSQFRLYEVPFFVELERKQAKNILLAGCGGGYDIYAGLPLYYALKDRYNVFLANYSFTEASTLIKAENIGQTICYKVKADTPCAPLTYFPERYLSEWIKKNEGEDVCVYTFERNSAGVKPLVTAYNTLIELLKIDTIILADGGTDSLMFGDEAKLGTPIEDGASIAAVNAVKSIKNKYLVAIGFGIDTFHGVSHALFLENVAKIISDGGFLGAMQVLKESPEAEKYKQISEFCFKKMDFPSIVNSSILSAVDGKFGNYHVTDRTRGSKLFINALMSQYWCFKLKQVAKNNSYLAKLADTKSYIDVSRVIHDHQASVPKEKQRKHVDLPM